MPALTSDTLFTRALQLIPGGVNSPVRAFRSVGGAPFFVKAARGATLVVGNQTLHDNGRLGVLDHPSVRAVAAKYPGRPGLDGERWLYG